MPASHRRTHVVIAGGGVAAVETALALHDLAGPRVRLTIIAPNPEFELRPLLTAETFSRDHMRRHSLAALAEQVDARLVPEHVVRIDPAEHRLVAGDHTYAYDALVVAVGGRHRPAFHKALTFSGDASSVDYNGLLRDVDEGYSRTVSFVVPPGTTWPLPLYELALATAAQAWDMGIDDARMEIVTPESAPLALFGPQAAAAIAGLLDRAGIDFRGGAYVYETDDHHLKVRPGDEPVQSRRVVALPTLEGPAIAGLPADDHGFIPVDDQGRVIGCDNVFAAGDGTTFPIKQGGIACQQADAIAELLAAAAGAPIEPQPFRPVLRGRVLTGRGAHYLEHALGGDQGDEPAPELRLWSAAHKVDGRYLSPWLENLDEHPVPAHDGDLTIDVTWPGAGHGALALDPYSPT